MKPWLKRRQSLGVYETWLADLPLEDECNYKNYLRMTSGNFEEIFQLIKDDIRKHSWNPPLLIKGGGGEGRTFQKLSH